VAGMPGAEPAARARRAPAVRRLLRVSFVRGLATGLAFNLMLIAGLVYLKLRDTSVNTWETLALGAFAAVLCVSPVQLLVSLALSAKRRMRPLSLGLFLAAVLGAIALVAVAVWSNHQANVFGREHGLA
jgi:hypothetical protein